MRVDEFDFHLPENLIALHPAEPRDSARLLVVRPGEPLADQHIPDLKTLLRPGDVLVVNDTRVLPAELKGTRLRGEGTPFVVGQAFGDDDAIMIDFVDPNFETILVSFRLAYADDREQEWPLDGTMVLDGTSHPVRCGAD